MYRKRKAFTLVELLAVIVILSTILVIGVPTLIDNLKKQKQVASNEVYELIKSAAKNYEIDYDIRERQSLPISDLCERYIACPIIDPATNEEIDGYISIGDGENRFLSTVKLDVTLNGGTPAQSFKERYGQYYTIRLLPPTKENNDFVEWRVVRGNSTIDDNILKFGDTDTEIFAVWQSWPTLTLDLDKGTIENNFGGIYKSGTIIELTNPTKEGYIFSGWVVASDNSVVSGNTFTMGSEDTTLKATWKPESLIYSYSCANTSGGEEPYNFTYTGNCTIIDDGNDNWRVKFLTSGTFTPNISTNIDVFLVGGGGGGSGGGANKAGGGGGYTLTKKGVDIITNTSYTITIGSGGYGGTGYDAGGNGGPTSAFSYTANGGSHGYGGGGSGGSGGGGGGEGSAGGGRGGVNGGNGSAGYHYYPGGSGQGTTTREFGESSGTLYSSGGSGGPGYTSSNGASGGNNTGNGAGGSGEGGTGGTGGSGIVVIRNARG